MPDNFEPTTNSHWSSIRILY